MIRGTHDELITLFKKFIEIKTMHLDKKMVPSDEQSDLCRQTFFISLTLLDLKRWSI